MSNTGTFYQTEGRARPLITRQHLFYLLFIIILTAFSLMLILPTPYDFAPLFIVAGLCFVLIAFRYPMVGIFVYLLIFFIKPNELFQISVPVPYERLVALIIIVRMLVDMAFVEKKIPLYRMDFGILAFYVAVFLSLLGATDLATARASFDIFSKVILVYFLITRIVNSQAKFKSVIWLYAFSVAFLGVYSSWSYYIGDYVTAQGIARAYLPGGGSYADPNSLATSLILGIPFMAYLIFYHRNIFLKIVLAAMIAACVWTVVLTGSRGGMLGVITVLLLMGLFSRRKLGTLVIAIVSLLVLAAVAPKEYMDRFATIAAYDQDDESGAGNSARGRIEGLKYGIKFFLQRPLTGVGMGNFPYHFYQEGKGWFNPHNMVAKLISELGILGIIGFTAFIYWFVRILREAKAYYREKKKTSHFIYQMSTAIQVALLMLFFQGLFGHNLYRFNWYIFASFAAIIYNLVKYEKESETPAAV